MYFYQLCLEKSKSDVRHMIILVSKQLSLVKLTRLKLNKGTQVVLVIMHTLTNPHTKSHVRAGT